MSDHTRAPVSPDLHAQLLRLCCEAPLSPVEAADRAGVTLAQLVQWSQDPRTREDFAALRDVADLSMQLFLSRHRLTVIAKLIEVAHETPAKPPAAPARTCSPSTSFPTPKTRMRRPLTPQMVGPDWSRR